MRKTNRAHFLFQKRDIFYFTRRVPSDLKDHYQCGRITVSLRTRSRRAAEARATSLAARLDEDWLTLRWKAKDGPLRRFLKDQVSTDVPILGEGSGAPMLTDAKDQYVRLKGAGRSITFSQGADRAVRYMVEVCGEKPIDTYSRAEVNRLRDDLFNRGLAQASVKRVLNSLRAIVNFTAKELGLDEIRTFSGLYLGEPSQHDTSKRNPIPMDALRSVQAECREIDDEARWLVGLISDTGMRLSEAAGLLKSDVVFESPYPHITLRPHPWRRLNTKGSERIVPLVGVSLWAAQRAIEESEGDYLFPRYCDETQCKANSASGALNKWLAPRVPDGCVIHSFRHSLRDRLRSVECPTDITDRLGGWKVGGVGEGYGDGYPVEVLAKWMRKIDLETPLTTHDNEILYIGTDIRDRTDRS